MLNIPYGTQVQDGVRSGPIFEDLSVDGNGNVFTSAVYDRYGITMLYSSNYTHSICPYTSVPGGVCAAQTVAAGPANLTLNNTGANSSCTLLKDSNGNNYIQLDWPRALSVTVAVADLGADMNLTVFGTDWYGLQMQESIEINAQAGANNPYKMAKAFFTITSVYLNGTPAANAQIAVQTLDTFGLPYVLKDPGFSGIFGWNKISYLAIPTTAADGGDPVTPVANTLITAASVVVPGNTSGDVRGTVTAPNAADAVKYLCFQYYVMGADQNRNIWNGMGFQEGILDGSRVQIPALNQAGFYGLPQYYTGVAA